MRASSSKRIKWGAKDSPVTPHMKDNSPAYDHFWDPSSDPRMRNTPYGRSSASSSDSPRLPEVPPPSPAYFSEKSQLDGQTSSGSVDGKVSEATAAKCSLEDKEQDKTPSSFLSPVTPTDILASPQVLRPKKKNRSIADCHEIKGRLSDITYLGSGSYGQVYSATDNKTGEKVAIKKIQNVFENDVNAKRLLREVRILRMLHHNNVIGFRGLLCPANLSKFNDLYIVFQFVDTDLQKIIASPQHFSNLHIKYFVYQICLGMRYIHSQFIIHRDLKPANLLINANCSLKICDFGLARTIEPERSSCPPTPIKSSSSKNIESKSAGNAASEDGLPALFAAPKRLSRQLTKHVVTRWYRAPELILLTEYTSAIDMWSVGCIFAELLSMQKESFEFAEERSALFPGKSCFPLSADHQLAYKDQLDQLNVIFNVIGTPKPSDIAKIQSEKARRYVKQMTPRDPVDFSLRYTGADPMAVDLLNKLLCFSPTDRLSATQALAHPYLAEVRDVKAMEAIKPPQQAWDFEDDKDLNEEKLRALIVEQILIDHPEAQSKENAE